MSDKTETKTDDNAGWEDISVSGPQNWHVCAPGNTLEGILEGRFYRRANEKTREKYFYRVKASKPVRVMRKEDMDEPAIERVAQKGETVCIDERKDLEDLAMLCDDGGKYLVRITPTEKIKIGGGQSFWRFAKQKKVIAPPTRTPKPPRFADHGPTRTHGDDDIPF